MKTAKQGHTPTKYNSKKDAYSSPGEHPFLFDYMMFVQLVSIHASHVGERPISI